MKVTRLEYWIPCAQVSLAILLLWIGHRYPDIPYAIDTPYAATAVMICHGLSAPAILLTRVGAVLHSAKIDSERLSIFGFDAADVLFLAGVALIWYLVVKAFRYASPCTSGQKTSRVWLNTILPLWGIYVLVFAIANFTTPLQRPVGGNSIGSMIEGGLFFLWSVGLICFPFWVLIRKTRDAQEVTRS